MRVVDQEGHEVQSPDLDLGRLEPGKVLVKHHEAVEAVPAVYEDQFVEEYENGGKLYKHVCVTPAVPGQAAWDEYEDVYVYVPYTEEELAEIEAQKQAEEERRQQEEQAAQEAKEKAEAEQTRVQSMNLAVKTMAMAVMPTIDFSEMSTSKTAHLFPFYSEWDPNGVSYKKGTPFTYTVDGVIRYFRASQDTVSTSVYKPGDPGTESIYYEFFVAPDGYEIYQPCKGEYNAYSQGDVVHYPDADSPLYESLVAGKNSNAYDPDTVPANWKLVEEQN